MPRCRLTPCPLLSCALCASIKFQLCCSSHLLCCSNLLASGGTNFAVLALVSLLGAGTYFPRQIVNSCLQCLWALRLSGFLLMRILMWGEDNRFDDKRDDPLKFLVFWVAQAFWVFTVSLPLVILNYTAIDRPVNAQDIVGWVMFGLGLFFEAVADQQKLLFKKLPREQQKQPWYAQCSPGDRERPAKRTWRSRKCNSCSLAHMSQ